MQLGSENADGEMKCVAIQGVHEAKPSAHAASVGAHAHRRSKCKCRVERVAVQGVHGAKPSVHAASLGAHAARLRKCRWRNEVCSHTGRTRSQAKRACSLGRRTCSWAQKMQMEN
jgi:hypothetical protein